MASSSPIAVNTITSESISICQRTQHGRALTGVLLFGTEEFLNLVTDFTFWHLDVILGGTIIRHEGQETIIGDIELQRVRPCSFPHIGAKSSYQLVFTTNDVRNLHVVGGWGEIFQLLASKDVESNQMDLRVTVLASLGSGHVDNLAWATLDDNETVLSQGGTLHRVGGRGTGIGGLEGVLMLKRILSVLVVQ